ncbi:hypothetical protein AcV5_001791 [Taiwanofungus camphoratus]|nr:hypothetical protein AcV5_001791 [Antrodia cinnamomea]
MIPTPLDWLVTLAVTGVVGFVAQVLLTTGLQREVAGRETSVYIQLIWARGFEWLFFRSIPPPLSIIRIVVILTSTIYVAVTEERSGAKNLDTAFLHRKRIGYLRKASLSEETITEAS